MNNIINKTRNITQFMILSCSPAHICTINVQNTYNPLEMPEASDRRTWCNENIDEGFF